MKRHLSLWLVLVLLIGGLIPGVFARAESADDFCGIWVADGVVAEIRREGGDEGYGCRVVFSDGDTDSDVWDYSGCWYDAEEKCLQCMNVTRTHQHFDKTWQRLEETDWSLNDMDFASCQLTETGLRFSCDDRGTSVDFVRRDADAAGARGAALAFVGLWDGEGAALKVEDCGVAYLFTVTAHADADTDYSWTYTCRYDPAEGCMASVEVSPRRVITSMPDGGSVEEEVGYSPSEARFTLGDEDVLLWSDVTDGDGGDMAFRRAGD